jgi:hypothetical protein
MLHLLDRRFLERERLIKKSAFQAEIPIPSNDLHTIGNVLILNDIMLKRINRLPLGNALKNKEKQLLMNTRIIDNDSFSKNRETLREMVNKKIKHIEDNNYLSKVRGKFRYEAHMINSLKESLKKEKFISNQNEVIHITKSLQNLKVKQGRC